MFSQSIPDGRGRNRLFGRIAACSLPRPDRWAPTARVGCCRYRHRYIGSIIGLTISAAITMSETHINNAKTAIVTGMSFS